MVRVISQVSRGFDSDVTAERTPLRDQGPAQVSIHTADQHDKYNADSMDSDISNLGYECTQLIPLFEDALRFWGLYHLLDEYRRTGQLVMHPQQTDFLPLPSQICGKL